MTGTGRGERSGDAPFESNKRRKKVTIYALNRSRKAWLKEIVEKLFPEVFRIKTENTFRQGTTGEKSKSRSPRSASCKVSLVAGNVTGGGGKATTTKTYRHCFLRKGRTICFRADRVLTGEGSPRASSGYKRPVMSNVYM